MSFVSALFAAALGLLPVVLPAAGAVPGAALTGTVRSIDGVPVAGARLILIAGDRVVMVDTDARGAFTFLDVTLPATVEITAPGFAPLRKAVSASPVEFTLSPASLTESVVVTADRPPAWRDADSGATVLTSADLETVPAMTLDERLRVVSGLSLFRRSSSRTANPTTHGVTMRGLSGSGSSRAVILLDGVPLNDGFGGWVTWTRLPDLAFDRVDIERGAEGDMFGSDALGGVIRIASVDSHKLTMRYGVQGGTLGLWGKDVAAGGGTRAFSAFGAGSWFTTHGAIPLEPASRGAVDRPASAHWSNGFGRIDMASKGRHLAVSGWGGPDHRGNGTVVQVNRMSGQTVAATFDLLGADSTFAARVSDTPNAFYQTFSTVSASRATETLSSTQNIHARTQRAVLEYGHSLPRGRLLVGANFARVRATFGEVKPTSTSSQDLRDDLGAVSMQAGFAPTAHVTFGSAVRHEWRAAPTTKNAYTGATVGHVSATWKPAPMLSLRGSVATSHRWPTLNELVRGFQAGAIVTQANADLKPEHAVSYAGSAAFERRKGQLSAGVFYTVVKDAIANFTLSNNLRQRRNAGEAHAKGVELDGELKPVEQLRIRASATIGSSRFLHSVEPALEGKKLAQVPRVSWSFSSDVRLPYAVNASVLWHASSSQFDDDRNQFLLARADQVDIRVGGRIGYLVRWFAVAENATNARIEVGRTPLVTLAPPRAFRVGLDVALRRR
jgi:outer membrane cobalamin receptor